MRFSAPFRGVVAYINSLGKEPEDFGELLLQFLRFYGQSFDMNTTGIEITEGRSFFYLAKPAGLVTLDPSCSANNTTRSSYNANQVLALFTNPHDHGWRARVILEEHFADENFNVRVWAAKCGFKNPRHLQRILKDVTGKSPDDILWQRRLNEAAKLLRSNDLNLNISEIGYSVGFKNATHFSNKFKEEFGTSPKEYKKR